MIVISDTSPLNYLVLIGAIDILPVLFDEIHVPIEVMRELTHPKTPELVKQWAVSPPKWMLINQSETRLSVDPSLDPGEAHALALAKELHANAILIDEKKGRRIAKEQGFATLGTVTVLELAAQKNLLELKSAFDLLQHTSFQISKIYIEAALERETARKLAQNERRR